MPGVASVETLSLLPTRGVLDTQNLVTNAKKLRDYCIRNRQTPVMHAVETLFDKDKK